MSKYLKPPANQIWSPKESRPAEKSDTIEKRKLPVIPKTLTQLANLQSDKVRPLTPSSARSAETTFDVDNQTFHAFIDRVMKLKAKMTLKKISRANCICNECGGMWDARIVGSKKHIWMHCNGCSRRFME